MSKILVTGANGFVGRHLIRELLSHGYNVLAIGGSQVPPPKESEGQEYMTMDLMNREETAKIDFSNITGAIHLAGMAAIGPSFDKPMDYITTNIGIEVNLFEAALAQKAKPRFIIISSSSLYDSEAAQPLTETSSVLPNSPYAVSKLGQEQMSEYYATRGFEAIIARPFNHIGPGQGPGFIVPDLAEQIVSTKEGEQPEVMVGNLDTRRDYTDVRDIVRAYRLLLEKGHSGEIYNICSGIPSSGHDILDGLTEAAGVMPIVKQDSTRMRPSDTPLFVGSHQKITSHTGWQPEIPLKTTLSDVMSDWRNRKK